jgi:LacI family transcriptional regulator
VKRAKLTDVAGAAGVSAATASLVLNENYIGRVGEEVADRVRAEAKKLNYRTNLLARNLRTKKSKTIGLISDTLTTSNFAGRMLAGAEDATWKRGWFLDLINTASDLQIEERAIMALLQHNVEGFIYASMYNRTVEKIPESLKNQTIIFLDCNVNNFNTHDSVVPAEYASATIAMEFLISKGHRDIGWIGISNPTNAGKERFRAFVDQMKKLKTENYRALVFETFESYANDGYIAARTLLTNPKRPTALFCFSDRMAMGAYRAASELGLRIPQDISIMGFDNQEHIAEALWPPLSTMQLPHYEMGFWAASRLINQLESKDSESISREQKQMICELVERGSVGPPPLLQ